MIHPDPNYFKIPGNLRAMIAMPSSMRNTVTKGQVLEKWVENNTGAKRTKASGALHGNGDLVSTCNGTSFYIECKYLSKEGETYLLQSDWKKACNQASRLNRVPVVVTSTMTHGAFYYKDIDEIRKLPLSKLSSIIGEKK